jgi:predicted Zn-dependent protease
MVVAAQGRAPEAVKLLQDSIQEDPGFEASYVTLARIYLDGRRPREATQVLERLLQRNPKNPAGLQILQQLKGGSAPK